MFNLANGKKIDSGSFPVIMGILNVTPDSFSDGGSNMTLSLAMSHAGRMIEEGAGIIDVGGESTRPGWSPVSEEEELSRVLPVVQSLVREFPDAVVSIDTSKPAVARACLDLGAHIINDVTGFEVGGEEMCAVAGEFKAGCILTHWKKLPPGPCTDAVTGYLKSRLGYCMERSGLDSSHFAVDPGIGFGKNTEQNLECIRMTDSLKKLGVPVVTGHSRKSFLGELTGRPAGERLAGTVAVTAIAAYLGADIIRVHDVAEARDACLAGIALRGRPGKGGTENRENPVNLTDSGQYDGR